MNDPHTSQMPAIREPAAKGGGDLASVMAALESRCSADGSPRKRMARAQARGVLTLVLIGLMVASAFELLTLTPTARTPETGSRASIVFSNAQSGACLGWPPDAPDKPSFVQCRADHMFEVVKPVGMDATFNEPCQLAVRDYLGTRYDPDGRFTSSVLGAGGGSQNLLCGLQLLGTDGKAVPFKGRIAELDQSKVWAVGTCLGIDASNRSTDIPVDCSAPHALEVTGAVNLAQNFPNGLPAEPEQRAFIDGACARMADGYLTPGTLPEKNLALGYQPLSPASWSAGSRQVACSVGRPAEQGWIPMSGSARSNSPADIQPAVEPPPSSPAAPPSSPAAPPPPPVYNEPLIPVATAPSPAPSSNSAPPEPSPSPSPSPSPTATAPPASPTTVTAPPEPSPSPLGPPPGPAEVPPENTGPTPGLLEIPGLPPITLPGYVPPEPPPPAPVPLGPPPGPA